MVVTAHQTPSHVEAFSDRGEGRATSEAGQKRQERDVAHLVLDAEDVARAKLDAATDGFLTLIGQRRESHE